MSIEAMKQAIEALEFHSAGDEIDEKIITSLRQAIAEAEKQEPVGINGLTEAETNATASVMGLVNKQERLIEPTEDMVLTLRGNSFLGKDDARDALRDILQETPLYTSPPQRQPLTDDFVNKVVRSKQPHLDTDSKAWKQIFAECKYWLEAAHGIKG